MDLAELLMVDHSSIRIIADNNLLQNTAAELIDFNKFLLNIHVNIEESIVFPLLKENNKEISKLIDRLTADHKLIETLFNNLYKWKVNDDPLFSVRLPLFYKTLKDHNCREESDVFPYWRNIDNDGRNTAMKNAHEIIESSDISNYIKETGISEKMLKYIFI
ncbi:hemerythrin domain-containing protein [Acidiplasma sp.]|uniref:hemerythrin domain-containing protein n=1 Tax=Acidiplasma sp. TaxID=1872114 RepID=UPI00258D6B2C|nr:hemerythrin domain-containing protein [Acidiplasma sp.]